MSILSKEYFHNELAAIKHLESIIWANGVTCYHCGSVDTFYDLKGNTTRPGLKKCAECRKPFTVKMGTVFESSHIPVYKWLQAVYLLSSSKKGFSAHQLHRTLEVTYKTAWFIAHRIREAMRELHLDPLGGNGKIVEADETFIGNKGKQSKGARGYAHKEKVFSLIERGGKVQSQHVERINTATLKPIMKQQIMAGTRLMTDEARQYIPIGKEFAEHSVVQHGIGEYVRGDIHTNTIEGFFSIFKRGMKGIYQHCGSAHLKRYLCEYDFRYNNRSINDPERAVIALSGIIGKRLMYKDSF